MAASLRLARVQLPKCQVISSMLFRRSKHSYPYFPIPFRKTKAGPPAVVTVGDNYTIDLDDKPLTYFGFSHGNPAGVERLEIPIEATLAAKEKGPWSELSKEEKLSLYRAGFVETLNERDVRFADGDDWLEMLVATGALMVVSFLVFKWTMTLTKEPESMLPERQEAQRQFMILNNIETFNDADRVYPRKGETKEELVARFVAVGISKENLIRYGYLEAEAGEEIVEEDGGEGSEEEGEEEE